MRIVLDSNVLVRAAKKRAKDKRDSPACEVLSLVRSVPHVLVLSDFLLTELERVLHYPRVRQIHQLSEEEIQTFVRELDALAHVENVAKEGTEPAISTDPKDNPIIQTAIAGRADILCTLDWHIRNRKVRAYCRTHGVRIFTDVGLLRVLRREQRRKGQS